MENKGWHKHIFIISLILTIFIFSIGFFLSYGLDILRVNEVDTLIKDYQLSSEAYVTQKEFINTFGGDRCSIIQSRIQELKREIVDVGHSLSNYGERSLFRKKDFDYLKRRYFLLELRFYSLLEELRDCDNRYIPILFFYKKDDDVNTRQGYVLDEINEDFRNQIVILSFDVDYKDEPLLELIKKKYNISETPSLVIDSKIKTVGIKYSGELRPTIMSLLNPIDLYARNHNFSWELKATGTNKSEYIKNLFEQINKTESNFGKGDIYLILGRLTNNQTLLCKAIDFYKKAETSKLEEEALILETIASIDCGNHPKEYLLNASIIWKKLGNKFRAELDRKLASFEPIDFELDPYPIPKINKTINGKEIIIGNSSFVLDSSDILVSQTDRVTRDWLSYQLNLSPYSTELLIVFSERLYLPEAELLSEIGWHEGARIKELKKTQLTHKIASGTIAVKINDSWYAPDEKGIFRFEVPLDKILYPTTRFLREDIALIIDTHGINMIVEQAVRYRASAVIGCCDGVGKIRAAKYLSDKGIKVICPTDKYVPLLLMSGSSVLGSPPIKLIPTEVILGGRPIIIRTDEKIIVQDVADYTTVQSYYDTPARYFKILNQIVDIDPIYIPMNSENQIRKILDSADFIGSNVIAVRIYSMDDYLAVKTWLDSDPRHKAILFHSISYPSGYRLFEEFPFQTSFDDINPIIR